MSRAPRWLRRLGEIVKRQPATLHECSDLDAVREEQRRIEREVQQMEREAEARLRLIDMKENNIRRES